MTDNPADTELGGKKSPRQELREKLKQQILDEHGAVKYDGEETEGSPFQGMYVYDGGKSAFAEDTLNAWIDSRMHLIDEWVAGLIGEELAKLPTPKIDEINHWARLKAHIAPSKTAAYIQGARFMRNRVQKYKGKRIYEIRRRAGIGGDKNG